MLPSRRRFYELIQGNGIYPVRLVTYRHFGSLEEVLQLLKGLKTKYSTKDQSAEGMYLRVDQGEWLESRAKLVQPFFTQVQNFTLRHTVSAQAHKESYLSLLSSL